MRVTSPRETVGWEWYKKLYFPHSSDCSLSHLRWAFKFPQKIINRRFNDCCATDLIPTIKTELNNDCIKLSSAQPDDFGNKWVSFCHRPLSLPQIRNESVIKRIYSIMRLIWISISADGNLIFWIATEVQIKKANRLSVTDGKTAAERDHHSFQ